MGIKDERYAEKQEQLKKWNSDLASTLKSI